MRLKRLEAYGFKSFADRLTFDFEDGITGIIGPNGCGKSNVVDGIKWVIGEQSAKALRGSEMADVIFNGCATRRPMALAEVTLTLDGVGKAKGLPDDEVQITRRLTQDGFSGYFINGRQVRLRDVKELLMDTGIGTSAYSVIEQGRIGFILEASTKDRRAILEEAAGISRYKTHRRQAARRLDRAKTDCERIGQVLQEVEKRHRTVKRQAETALRYRELQERLRELRMVFALEEYGRLSKENAGFEEALADKRAAEAEAMKGMGEIDEALTRSETEQLEFEDRMREDEESRAEALSRRDVSASRIADAKARLVEIDQQEGEDREALEQHRGKVDVLREEQAKTERLLHEQEAGGDDDISRLYQQRRKELDAVLDEIDAQLGKIDDQKNQQVEALREIARIEAEQGRIASTHRGLVERKERLNQRSAGHADALAEAQGRERDARERVEGLEKDCDALHASLDDLLRRRETAQAEGQHLDNRLNELRHEEARADTRLKLLAEYERKAEGLSRGVRDIVEQIDRFPGVVGLVADRFRVDKDHERAIETALGAAAQNVITETARSAKDAIDWLRREKRGRATFLPLDDLHRRVVDRDSLAGADGVVGVGADLVDYDAKLDPAFRYLLGNTVVMADLDAALALRRGGCRAYLVTLEGDVVQPGGAMTGGRSRHAEAGGLVSRKNEIRRLEERLEKLAAERRQAGEARDAAKKLTFDLAMKVEERRREIQKREHELADAKAQLMKAERDRLHCEEFAASFGNELEEIDAELAAVENEEVDLEGQHEWFAAMRTRLEEALAEQQAILRGQAERRDRMQEEVSNLRVDVATSEERRESLRNHLGHLDSNMRELDETRIERERRLAALEERRRLLREQIAEDEAIHAREAERFERVAADYQRKIEARDSIRHRVEELRQESRRLGQRLRGVEQARQEIELKLGEQRVRVEGLAERILEDYEVDLAEAFENWERPDDLDLPAVRRELAECEKQAASLGPVNLTAIDELEVVEARRDYLASHFEDLTAAIEKLDGIIEGIDATCRKLFKQTYEEVHKNFQTLFRKLYGGGSAEMKLIYDDDDQVRDILDAGIEIVARPPGKQPKSITLLSGGEKALTAIALLFAVYQSKPSPFCILDEVDGPLDESNTDVYCHMLSEFADKSQFLVITHNKRTMQYADALYGITHAEPGVSTKISVKTEEVDRHKELLATAGGKGPFSD